MEPLEDRLTPATFVVNTRSDSVAADAFLSLREAVIQANANPDADTITFDPALTAGGAATLFLDSNGLNGTSPDPTFGPSALAVSTPVTIQGPTGANGITIARGFNSLSLRLFYVTGGGSLTLQDLTLSRGLAQGGNGFGGGGGAAGLGGAIVNAGTLTLDRVTLTDNQALGGSGSLGTAGAGGGLGGNAGDITGGPPNGGAGMNGAGGFGGGGGFGSNGTAPGGFGGGGGGPFLSGNGNPGGFGGGGGAAGTPSMVAATVGGVGGFGGGNGGGDQSAGGGGGAGLGGAVFNYGGTVTITNSTLANNTAQGGAAQANGGTAAAAAGGSGYGGAVFNLNGVVTITNSTLANNIASTGGGAVYNLESGGEATQSGPALTVRAATVALTNTILAGSANAVGVPVTDFGASSRAGTGSAPPTRPQTAGWANNIVQRNGGFAGGNTAADPLLTPLGSNGGPTQTFALQTGSPAIDAGTPTGAPAVDQRGTARPQGVGFDIGAFEVAVAPVVLTVLPPALPPGRAGADYSVALTASGTVRPAAFTVTGGSLPAGLTLTLGGQLSGTPTAAGSFDFTVTATASDGSGSRSYSLRIDAAAPTPGTGTGTPARTHLDATGSARGSDPVVRVTRPDGSTFTIQAFDPSFRGGVDVAVADLDGDGTDDILVGAGPSGGPVIKVFDGVTGQLVTSFFAYDPSFRGGVSVGTVVLADGGPPVIVTGAGAGGAPHVKEFRFNGAGLAEVASFFAFDPAFRGGVDVATGDLNGDGRAELLLGAGPGGAPVVSVFDGVTGARIAQFYAVPPGDPNRVQDDRNGVRVAVADVDGNGANDIVTRTVSRTGAVVILAFDPRTGVVLSSDPALLGVYFA